MLGLILKQVAASGVSSMVAASGVCRKWHAVVRSDSAVLTAAAASKDAVLKGEFCGMFALSPVEAKDYPHSLHSRRNGGVYCLYRAEAMNLVMLTGMHALRTRISTRAREISGHENTYGPNWRELKQLSADVRGQRSIRPVSVQRGMHPYARRSLSAA